MAHVLAPMRKVVGVHVRFSVIGNRSYWQCTLECGHVQERPRRWNYSKGYGKEPVRMKCRECGYDAEEQR